MFFVSVRAVLERADGAKAAGLNVELVEMDCLRLALVGTPRSESIDVVDIRGCCERWSSTSSFFQSKIFNFDFGLSDCTADLLEPVVSRAHTPRFLIPMSTLTILVGLGSRAGALRRLRIALSNSDLVPAVGRPMRNATCFNWAAFNPEGSFGGAMLSNFAMTCAVQNWFLNHPCIYFMI